MVTFTNDEIKALKSMSLYWKEVRGREDQSPLEHEADKVYQILGASRLLACVEIAVAGANNGGGS